MLHEEVIMLHMNDQSEQVSAVCRCTFIRRARVNSNSFVFNLLVSEGGLSHSAHGDQILSLF